MEDTSWLDEENVEPQGEVTERLNKLEPVIKELRRLQDEMDMAEEVFKQAKKKYEIFAKQTVPDMFKMNGFTSIEGEDGRIVSIVTNTSVHVVKEQKRNVCDWLRQHNGDFLVKEQLIVDTRNKETLRQAGIAFDESVDVNTNSLKAFLLDELGQRGGTPNITVDEIPAGIGFYQWDEAQVRDR